jgi:DNA-binding Lrp family transcriptional regulator
MIVSYTLARVVPAQDKTVYEELMALNEVKGIVMSYGVFDIMITIETDNIDELDNIVFNKIRKLEGIISTTTLIGAAKEEKINV